MTRTHEQHDTERLIAARVRRGYTEHESRQLLAELIAAHDGDNLDAALKYNDFTR